jgi:hypothetical protein
VLERVVERFLGDLVQLLPDQGRQPLRALHLQVGLQAAARLHGIQPHLQGAR